MDKSNFCWGLILLYAPPDKDTVNGGIFIYQIAFPPSTTVTKDSEDPSFPLELQERSFSALAFATVFILLDMDCAKCHRYAAILSNAPNSKFSLAWTLDGSRCHDCYVEKILQNVKTVLARNKIVSYGGQVVVACSGGPHSMALLHLLDLCCHPENSSNFQKFMTQVDSVSQESIHDEPKSAPESKNKQRKTNKIKHMKFSIFVIHVISKNNSSLYDNQQEENRHADIIRGFAESRGMQYLQASLLDHPSNHSYHYRRSDQDAEHSHDKYHFDPEKLRDQNDVDDVKRFRLFETLTAVAKEIGAQNILLGESSDRIAINVITNTTKGRGLVLPLTVASVETHGFSEVNFIKPFRNVSAREIMRFARFEKIDRYFCISRDEFFGSTRAVGTSLNRLASDFVQRVHADMPSAVGNILGTIGKFGDGNFYQHFRKCSVCSYPFSKEKDKAYEDLLGQDSLETQDICYACSQFIYHE